MVDEPITLQELRVRDVQVHSDIKSCFRIVLLVLQCFTCLLKWLVMCRMSHMLAGED